MDKELKRHYSLMVDFLGHVLGPDYEIALHELTDASNRIVAIANGELTGRHLGSPLSNKLLEYVTVHLHETQDYVLRFETVTDSGRKMCSNTMFIKGRDGELAGLLCVNFDAGRYEELSRRVMELCDHMLLSGAPSGTRLVAEHEAPETAYPRSIAGATAHIVADVLADYPAPVERLTQEEKMAIMGELKRKGVFLLKGSVSYVAGALRSSEASIYRYLGKLNDL